MLPSRVRSLSWRSVGADLVLVSLFWIYAAAQDFSLVSLIGAAGATAILGFSDARRALRERKVKVEPSRRASTSSKRAPDWAGAVLYAALWSGVAWAVAAGAGFSQFWTILAVVITAVFVAAFVREMVSGSGGRS
jgi:hypothetical protein